MLNTEAVDLLKISNIKTNKNIRSRIKSFLLFHTEKLFIDMDAAKYTGLTNFRNLKLFNIYVASVVEQAGLSIIWSETSVTFSGESAHILVKI